LEQYLISSYDEAAYAVQPCELVSRRSGLAPELGLISDLSKKCVFLCALLFFFFKKKKKKKKI
jgi:hypothetical protein